MDNEHARPVVDQSHAQPEADGAIWEPRISDIWPYVRMWGLIFDLAEIAMAPVGDAYLCETLSFFGTLDLSQPMKSPDSVTFPARREEHGELVRVYFDFTNILKAPVRFQLPGAHGEPFLVAGRAVRTEQRDECLKILLVDNG